MVISYCTLFIELSIVVQFSENFDTNLSKCGLKHFPHGVNAKSTKNMVYMVATSWSLLGPGVEVGLTLSFIDYVGVTLK
jgi:hypothetical protein